MCDHPILLLQILLIDDIKPTHELDVKVVDILGINRYVRIDNCARYKGTC